MGPKKEDSEPIVLFEDEWIWVLGEAKRPISLFVSGDQ